MSLLDDSLMQDTYVETIKHELEVKYKALDKEVEKLRKKYNFHLDTYDDVKDKYKTMIGLYQHSQRDLFSVQSKMYDYEHFR